MFILWTMLIKIDVFIILFYTVTTLLSTETRLEKNMHLLLLKKKKSLYYDENDLRFSELQPATTF